MLSRSSPFLRDRLGDASISREHVRIEVMSDGGNGGDGGSEDAVRDAAAAVAEVASPSARVTVVGSNPVVLLRGKVTVKQTATTWLRVDCFNVDPSEEWR